MAAIGLAPLQTLSLISECYQGKFRPYQPGDWWSQTGSNRRPQACKASALPTELWPRPSGLWSSLKLVGLSGLEPLTSRLSGVCSNHLSYRPLTVRRPSGRRSGAYAPPQRSSRASGLMTVVPKGIPIGLNLPNILGRKRNEAGARAKGPPDTMSGIIGAAEAAGPCVPISNREELAEAISIRVQP